MSEASYRCVVVLHERQQHSTTGLYRISVIIGNHVVYQK